MSYTTNNSKENMQKKITFINQFFNSNRVKSFLWRAGAIMVVAGLNFIATNLGEFDLNPEIVVLIGLIIGEITKAINNVLQKSE